MTYDLLALHWPGPFEMIVLLVLGLLFFGNRLPEVGRSLGKTIIEFKKGMREVEQEISRVDDNTGSSSSFFSGPALNDQTVAKTTEKPTFKFDPYTGKPVEPAAASTPSENS